MATYIGTNGDNTYVGPGGEVNFINGKKGADHLTGGYIFDSILGGDGADTLIGLQGDDILDGGADDDSILGGEGDDSILTGGGSNIVDAGRGDDIVDLGGAGAAEINVAVGGTGDDVFVAGTGSDRLDGGVGVDEVNYSRSGDGVFIDMRSRSYLFGHAQNDRLRGIENVVGSRHEDVIAGTGLDNQFHGGQGQDELNGGGGSDILIGAAGDDALIGGPGDDELDGGTGNDIVYYQSGSDLTVTIDGFGFFGDAEGDFLIGIENVVCSGAGVHTVTGSQAPNVLIGDVLQGLGGADTLEGAMMTGGFGPDVFRADNFASSGDWTITDFNDDTDKIDLHLTIGWEDLTIQAFDADSDSAVDDVRIFVTTGTGEDLYVLNRDPAIFDASDFI